MREIAEQYLELGLSVLPVSKEKIPMLKEWKDLQKRFLDPGETIIFERAYGIAIVCGEISGQLEIIDIDTKYDNQGYSLDFLKKAKLLAPFTVQRTPSGGYHLIYRHQGISKGNKKLAGWMASDKKLYFLETRGEGGYFVASPTQGYKMESGSFDSIPTITSQQHDELFELAYSYNEIPIEEYEPSEPVSPVRQQHIVALSGLSPFSDYDNKADVVSLLQQHGWKYSHRTGSKVHLKRPGSDNKYSGNWDEQRGWFSVFSPNTEFEPQRAYRAYAVYAILEHQGDFSAASKALYEQGYGDRRAEKKTEILSGDAKVVLEPAQYLSDAEEDWKLIDDFAEGRIEKGLITGWPELDENFRFKKGNFVMVNGNTNVGKTTFVLFLAMISCMLHGWKWIIFTRENRSWSAKRRLAEFYLRKSIERSSLIDRKNARDFVEENFTVINAEKGKYTVEQLLETFEDVLSRKEHHCSLIDPYNAMAVNHNHPVYKKSGKHDYNYEMAELMFDFKYRTGCGLYLNVHAYTGSTRQRDKDKMPIAPRMEDTEGGNLFANRADDFCTVHRLPGHKDRWKETQFHVRKIKETETGGRATAYDLPFIALMTGTFEFRDISGRHPFDYKVDDPMNKIKRISSDEEDNEFSKDLPF